MGKSPNYPGLSKPVNRVFNLVGRGILPHDKLHQVIVKSHSYYHVLAYGTGGSTQLNFFNAGRQQGVTNWPGAGGLPTDYGFWLHAVRVVPLPHTTSAGARGAAAMDLDASASDTAPASLDHVSDLMGVFEAGILTIQCGGRTIVDSIKDLRNFPQGSGMVVESEVAGTYSSGTAQAVGTLTNGLPVRSNAYTFPVPIPIAPQKAINAKIDWPSALAVTGAFGLQLQLDGMLVHRANL